MQLITTTGLRTKTKQLVKTLKSNGVVSLVHRSRIIAKIEPLKEELPPFKVGEFKKATKALDLPKLSPKERERKYREHLVRKYGQSIP